MRPNHPYTEIRRRWFGLAAMLVFCLTTSWTTGTRSALAEESGVEAGGTGSLLVIDTVQIDHGGLQTAEDFTITITDATGSQIASFAGDAEGTTIQDLTPGTYTVTQTGPSGFVQNFTGCGGGTVVVSEGETAVCHIIDNDKTTEVTVQISVENTNGGLATDADFTAYLGDTEMPDNVPTRVYIGTYTVEIVGPDGYAPTFSGDCDADGVMEVTGTTGVYRAPFVCTVVLHDTGVLSSDSGDDDPGDDDQGNVGQDDGNQDEAPGDDDAQDPVVGMATLDVVTHVINDHGGDFVASDFTFAVRDQDGNEVTSSTGSEAGIEIGNLDPGTYTVEQTDGPSGFILDMSACGAEGVITVYANETTTCRIVDNDKTNEVTVNMVVINDDGGTAVADDFDLFAGDIAMENGVSQQLYIGTYQISEQGPAGYDITFSGDCDADGVLEVTGNLFVYLQPFTCTVTANDTPPGPVLVVRKDVEGGPRLPSDFSLTVVDAAGNVMASFPGDSNGTALALDPGTYTVGEQAEEAYDGSFSGDCDANGVVTLAEDGTSECILTNTFHQSASQTAQLTVVKDVINDDGGTSVAGDFTITIHDADGDTVSVFAGSEDGVTVTALATGTYTIEETGPDGYGATFSGDCDAAGQIVLTTDAEPVCTITNNDTAVVEVVPPVHHGGGGGSVTHVVVPPPAPPTVVAPPAEVLPPPAVLSESLPTTPPPETPVQPPPGRVLGVEQELPVTGIPSWPLLLAATPFLWAVRKP